MKTRLKHLFLYAALFMICGAPTISFDALFPARLPLPEHVKTIAIIDRTGRESKLGNIVEGGLTGEGIGLDKEASKAMIDGLVYQITRSGKYNAIRTNITMKSDISPREMAAPLGNAQVKGICMEFKADAVLSIELFDTDHILDRLDANVGIRLYDGIKNQLIDDFSFKNSAHIPRRNDDILNMVSNYLNKDVLINLSYDCGIVYGQRISPYWLRISREYYKKSKGDRDFAMGARMMEVNDWEQAIDAFETALKSNKRKTLGRASHNLAVIYEILGDYPKAREYAQDAWAKYKNKDSKNYSYVLSQRIAETEILENQ